MNKLMNNNNSNNKIIIIKGNSNNKTKSNKTETKKALPFTMTKRNEEHFYKTNIKSMDLFEEMTIILLSLNTVFQ